MRDNCICPNHLYKDKDGYPRVKWKKRMWGLNRLMWYLSFGPIPVGQVVAHTCNNSSCVNPNHFYLSTPQQNSTDAATDGLYLTGKSHPKFKHSVDTAVAYQRYINGESQQQIADSLGISQSSLSARFIRYKQKGLISE